MTTVSLTLLPTKEGISARKSAILPGQLQHTFPGRRASTNLRPTIEETSVQGQMSRLLPRNPLSIRLD